MKLIRRHGILLAAFLITVVLLNRFLILERENLEISWTATPLYLSTSNSTQTTKTHSTSTTTTIASTTTIATSTTKTSLATTELPTTVKDDLNGENRTYFFVETSNSSHFTARQACAVESVARLHPYNPVKLLYIYDNFNLSNPLVPLLLKYKNVQFSHVNVDEMMKGSPLEPWIRERPWTKSPYNVSHLSDVMRTLLMWKYGGVYLDLDIVVLRSLENFKNAIGLQSTNYLAAGVLIFEKSHPAVNASIHELFKTYSSWRWGYNGPELYLRVLQKLCNVSKFTDLPGGETKNCSGVLILPPSAFYPLFYTVWRKYFRSSDASDTIMQWLQQNSYLIHVWNKFAEKEPLVIGSGQPYELAAKYYCPNVYNHMKPFKKM